MNILAFTDIHNEIKYLNKVHRLSKKADIVVFLGDLSIFGQVSIKLIEKLKKIPKIILMLHGNHDDEEVMKDICEDSNNLVFLHKQLFTFEDTLFLGYGGGGFSLKEPEFERFVQKKRNEISKYEKIVLATHAPPKDSCLDELDGVHFGNKSFKKFITKQKNKKILALSGHFHENEGRLCKEGNVIFCNPGPAGMIIDF